MSNRREYLGVVATGLAAAVGGCLQDGGEGSADEATDEPTDDESTDTVSGEPTETETGNGTGESGETPLEGMIDITGSSTMFPIAQAVAQRFKEREPAVSFEMVPTGTGGGFSDRFCSGDADFNNASRPITSDEQRLCADSGVEYHELTLARDAVTVVVNTDNDWLDCATTDQLRQLWRADGATTWADVDSSWPDEEIVRYGPADTSGTLDYFEREVIGGRAAHTSEYEGTERDDTILDGVESDRYAIGYLPFAYYRQDSDGVTAVGIDDGDGCVDPSLDTAANGDYPLARPLFTYVNTDRLAEDHVAAFARYYVEQSANEGLIADEVGYVPNTEAQMQTELAALNDAIADAQ